MTPAREHYEKYEAIAQAIGIDNLIPLIKVDADTIRAALAKDPHLNTIPLAKWDRWAGFHAGEALPTLGASPIPTALRSCRSLCERGCTLKHVARHHIAGVPAPD